MTRTEGLTTRIEGLTTRIEGLTTRIEGPTTRIEGLAPAGLGWVVWGPSDGPGFKGRRRMMRRVARGRARCVMRRATSHGDPWGEASK
jgi:hypothetical protein